jgi:UDP-2-acetamido-2,6-beta-L-arabino-hexul-4-ose reductase
MRVLVTGSDGFIGRNLAVRLAERGDILIPFTRADAPRLESLVAQADMIVHLAGANRPPMPDGFAADNTALAERLAAAMRAAGGRSLAFASSTQASLENPYGESKRAAEEALAPLSDIAPVAIFRLPNVFGKWARPFYNSAVATFCHQAANGLPLSVNNPASLLSLVYVDDVCEHLLAFLDAPAPGLSWPVVSPTYETSVGEVADMILGMARAREALGVGATGTGLPRALYATLLSHLPHDRFSYAVPAYGDPRGRFVEAVKTPDAGQLSYFTQVPGVERGGHYHHSKSEKFLVVRGAARFRFRHLLTGERVDVDVYATEPRIVDTIPGWAHDVVNLGSDELVVLVWANEVFDRARPDTIPAKVVSA